MEMYIHYKSLPERKTLTDVVGELNEVLEDVGAVCQARPGGGEGLPPAGGISPGYHRGDWRHGDWRLRVGPHVVHPLTGISKYQGADTVRPLQRESFLCIKMLSSIWTVPS